jgi:hypothetical protein
VVHLMMKIISSYLMNANKAEEEQKEKDEDNIITDLITTVQSSLLPK